MMQINKIKTTIAGAAFQKQLKEIYVDAALIDYQQERYQRAVDKFYDLFGGEELSIFSAPGRSEVIGNHTDHQRGCVVAAAINRDVLAVTAPSQESTVRVLSEGYDLITIDLNALDYRKEEEETTLAIIKGTIQALAERGYECRGFDAYITSDVLKGSGLSSSAAFEVLIGTIISGLFHQMTISPIMIAQAAQYAENVYFGKPSGLMDQMSSSVGALTYIDFADPEDPVVEKIEVDFDVYGYSLCIVDTKGSHADLTPDYAAIPQEMGAVARMFGKSVLREVDPAQFYDRIDEVRQETGDRAVLRALHFFTENARVIDTEIALKAGDFGHFLEIIRRSGDSSFKYLQNVYSNHDSANQGVSLGLAVSELALNGKGAFRVHGGGFAGTVQAFVPNDLVDEYKKALDAVFGEGACSVLKIRPCGGIQVL